MSTSQHTTQSGEPDKRFAENQEGEPYQKHTRQGGQGGHSGQGGSDSTSGTQGQSNLGGEHMTKEGKPDMRFKENQEGEPYQKEAGQKGGQARGSDSDNYGSRGQGNQGGTSEHLTKEGEPDMRFKENKEAYGQS